MEMCKPFHKYYDVIILISFVILFPLRVIAQSGSIPELFIKVNPEPQVIRCENTFDVNNQGGHLQGVQLYVKEDVEYAILSGSSGTYAYYSVAKLDNFSRVLSVNILMHKPFKHAGGIQVFHDLMAVGIEDNETKDKSRVCIYKIENPEKPPVESLSMIERNGKPFISTAGCVGINRIGGQYLIIVGDWDTKHLDFYVWNAQTLGQETNTFKKAYTLDTERIDKSGWTDKAWNAYQNINLLKDTDGKLYLFGFGRNAQNENIADLFLIEQKDIREFSLKKLMSKTFNCREGADFRSGAGIFLQSDGKLKVIGCGSHINESLILNVFE